MINILLRIVAVLADFKGRFGTVNSTLTDLQNQINALDGRLDTVEAQDLTQVNTDLTAVEQ